LYTAAMITILAAMKSNRPLRFTDYKDHPRKYGRVDPKRSEMMRSVKSRDTRPEIALRKALFAKGYRFNVNKRNGLPCTPDVVFPRKKIAIFINGCFWHQHHCLKASIPKVRAAYWKRKLEMNISRDKRNHRQLRSMGWKVIVIWECQINKDIISVQRKTVESIRRWELKNNKV
jgi:DNA mismatch endonuclease, patch repair protein